MTAEAAGGDGTTWLEWPLWSSTARLVVTDDARLGEARAVVEAILDGVDRVASRFRPDSEILNLRPEPSGAVTLSPVLADLLAEALRAAALSDGSVDPTVGAALVELGYDRDIRLVMRDGAPVRATVRPLPGWRRVSLHGSRLTMPPGTLLDLGATAKAAAADRCAAAVSGRLGCGVLVCLGGDIASAGPGPRGGWQIDVRDGAEDPGARVSLRDGTAMATSSTTSRVWRQGGRPVHHIVDPRTGRSAVTPWRTVTVVACSCVEANTASTATLAKGAQGLPWLSRLGLPARLVQHDGSVVLLAGWPREVHA